MLNQRREQAQRSPNAPAEVHVPINARKLASRRVSGSAENFFYVTPEALWKLLITFFVCIVVVPAFLITMSFLVRD